MVWLQATADDWSTVDGRFLITRDVAGYTLIDSGRWLASAALDGRFRLPEFAQCYAESLLDLERERFAPCCN